MTRASATAGLIAVVFSIATFDEQRLEAAEAAARASHDPARTAATGDEILSGQPDEIVDRLMNEHVIVLQEIATDGPVRGGIISAYVLFDQEIQDVYRLLSQSNRQAEYRPELTSVERIEMRPAGPIEEQRLKILFQRYVYRLSFRLEPAGHRIEWELDKRFENDLKMVRGFWKLYPMADGRTRA